jgi:hypothetical protein
VFFHSALVNFTVSADGNDFFSDKFAVASLNKTIEGPSGNILIILQSYLLKNDSSYKRLGNFLGFTQKLWPLGDVAVDTYLNKIL